MLAARDLQRGARVQQAVPQHSDLRPLIAEGDVAVKLLAELDAHDGEQHEKQEAGGGLHRRLLRRRDGRRGGTTR